MLLVISNIFHWQPRGAFPKSNISKLWSLVLLESIGNDGTCDHCCFWETHPRMRLFHYNKNAENVKLYFSLCDFSDIAKRKVNKIA